MRLKPNVSGLRPKSKAKAILLFLSLFILSFFLWFVVLIFANPYAKEESPRLSNEADVHQTNDIREASSTVDEDESSLFMDGKSPEGYSPALVVMTSTNGADRTAERERVFNALCFGENADLLRKYEFKIYLSIDAVVAPGPLAVPAACSNVHLKPIQRHQQSAQDQDSTARIAAHYQFAMKMAFTVHSHVIFLEDDLVPASDFISLFVPSSPAFQALQANPRRVWCVSAWNDMGVRSHASDVERLFRTDFFPGLGWMTTKRIWEDAIRRKWSIAPTTGWDNWLRSNNDEERDCIVPEVNRVKHVSSSGTNVRDPENRLYGVYSFPSETQQNTQWKLVGGMNEAAYLRYEMKRVREAKRVDFFRGQHSIDPTPGDVLILYERSTLKLVLTRLNAHPPMIEPRSAKNGLIAMRRIDKPDAFYYLCDLVRCGVQLFPKENLVPTTARILRAWKGKSCDETCSSAGLRCNKMNLQTIAYPPGKACVLMRTHFDCSLGCGHQVGAELPAMAVDKKEKTAGQCLMGESAVPDCESAHSSTRRLCSCVE